MNNANSEFERNYEIINLLGNAKVSEKFNEEVVKPYLGIAQDQIIREAVKYFGWIVNDINNDISGHIDSALKKCDSLMEWIKNPEPELAPASFKVFQAIEEEIQLVKCYLNDLVDREMVEATVPTIDKLFNIEDK